MGSQYTVNTVPHNLCKEETIVQIVEVLDHLNAITQDIFARVNKRLELNIEQLSGISKRIETAASKVERLKGDKKAKTVFSSSKYPAADVNRDYVSIFSQPLKVERVKHKVKYGRYISTYEPLSRLQFFHVKMPDQKNKLISEGLGDIPADIQCINDLLLFNTGKNVYKGFKSGDSLKGPEIVNNQQDYATSELGAAPWSISQRSSMQQANKDNYFYTPKIEELPALDVPWDLPDLPGIADDIRYETDMAPSIGPSVVNNTSQIPVDLELPDMEEMKIVPDIVTSPPPPPPPHDIPEPPPISELPKSSDSVLEQLQASGANEKLVQLEETNTVDSAPKPVISEQPQSRPPPPPQVDSRASLMDAIRKAGGSQKANLRKASERPQTDTKKSAVSSGDLMADLHSKLMMRRKGISGTKQADQGNGSNLSTADSAFARLSSIIPPPAKNSDVGSGVSTDEEAWNDDDDDA